MLREANGRIERWGLVGDGRCVNKHGVFVFECWRVNILHSSEIKPCQPSSLALSHPSSTPSPLPPPGSFVSNAVL